MQWRNRLRPHLNIALWRENHSGKWNHQDKRGK